MQFTTLTYFFFFLTVYSLYWLLTEPGVKKYFLLIASLIFYASWSFPFLLHFLLILSINYAFSHWIRYSPSRFPIRLCTAFNLLNLGFFKYFYFFLSLPTLFFSSYTFDKQTFPFEIVLPLAISFYTFQIIAYQVDVYRGLIPEPTPFLEYLLFFVFFPQLIAGPILRAKDFLPQFLTPRSLNANFVFSGIVFILTGITKKVLLADNISTIIDPVWTNPGIFSPMAVFLAVNGFCWQIYCDFSGYSDIAIGSAYLLGYQIPKNFRAPFLSSSFSELWKNWHTSLSGWLKDYLYVSLGGNRLGTVRMYFNLLMTFTLGGLWHGANITYILWGFLCGFYLVIERILSERWGHSFSVHSMILKYFGKYLGIVWTYLIFCTTVIFFRSQSLEMVPEFFKKFLFLSKGVNTISHSDLLPYLGIAFLLQWLELKNIESIQPTFSVFIFLGISSVFLMILLGLYSGNGKEFIYFQF